MVGPVKMRTREPTSPRAMALGWAIRCEPDDPLRLTAVQLIKDAFAVARTKRQAAEIFVRDKVPARSTAASIPRRAKRNRIRIGYFSADYYIHATCYLMAELFERRGLLSEFTSPTYTPTTLMCYADIAELCQEPAMARLPLLE